MKKLYVIFLVLVLALVIIMPVGVINADSTIKISGEVVINTEECVLDMCIGHYMIGQIKNSLTFDGSFRGKAVEDLTYWLGPHYSKLEFSGTGLQNFTGTLLGGKVGTYTARVFHQGWDSMSPLTESCEQIFISSAGGLANLNGTVYFEIYYTGDSMWEGTYSGQVTLAQ